MRTIRSWLWAVLVLVAPGAFGIELADKVVVNKSEKTLSLYKKDRLLKKLPVVFGDNPVGHKQQEGDERTPEGWYVLDFKKSDSSYYKSIHISYPNAKDIERAKAKGVSPGGAIMIHGQPNGMGWAASMLQMRNWTNGCIALTNEDMELVWQSVVPGTPIHIQP